MFTTTTRKQEKQPLLLRLQHDDDSSEDSVNYYLFYLASFSFSLLVLLLALFALMQPVVPDSSGSFSLTQFNISEEWELDLSFSSGRWNLYDQDGVFFERLEGVIYYKEDIPVALTWAEPLSLGSKEQGEVHLRFETPSSQPVIEKGVLLELRTNWLTGPVRLGLRIEGVVRRDAERWDLLWAFANCWDLVVKFDHNSGTTTLLHATTKQCMGWRFLYSSLVSMS